MPAALLLIGLLISKNDENFQLLGGGGVAPPAPPGSGHHWKGEKAIPDIDAIRQFILLFILAVSKQTITVCMYVL